MRAGARALLGTILPAALLAGACGGGGRPPPTASVPGTLSPELEDRAVLILLADRDLYDPFTVRRILSGSPGSRVELAAALGRIADPRGYPALVTLLRTGDPAVRAAAAFSLGLLGDPQARPDLLAAAAGDDAGTGARAVQALAMLETPLADVMRALAPLGELERQRRLLPHLARFPPAERLPVARQALGATPAELGAWAVYALGRDALPAAAPELRQALAHPDPWARGWAARGLGTVGERGDLARLLPLLDDPAPGPTIQALRAARRLIADGRAPAPAGWTGRLLALLADPRPGVRLTAIEAAGAWLRHEELGAALDTLARQGGDRERQLALGALAAGGDPRAADRVAEAAASGNAGLRAAAAGAAAELALVAPLADLATDPEPGVRLAALAALLERADDPEPARLALRDVDPAVRATALDWLAVSPGVEYAALLRAMIGPGSGRLPELRMSGVRALLARALAEPLERGAIVGELEGLAESADPLARREASRALGELGRPQPPVGPLDTGLELAAYRHLAVGAAGPRFADLETGRGTLRLELHCRRAPVTCANFLQLANQGFYDGLTFHRVVPDFVVQGGDPRGDGWGGPGYTIRDEPWPASFERGVIGMALSGPDTGGSQLFITLSRQPHLDGSFTAFGRVVAGEELLDLIVQGDRIESLREAAGGVR